MLREGVQCADPVRAEIGPDAKVEAVPGPMASTARRRPDAKNNTSEKRSHCQRERNLSGTLRTARPPAAGSQAGLGLGSAREQGAARGLGGARRSSTIFEQPPSAAPRHGHRCRRETAFCAACSVVGLMRRACA
jgi:hypothetical protein